MFRFLLALLLLAAPVAAGASRPIDPAKIAANLGLAKDTAQETDCSTSSHAYKTLCHETLDDSLWSCETQPSCIGSGWVRVGSAAGSANATAAEITTEALKETYSLTGHALPLYSTWATGCSSYQFTDLRWQLELIDQGFHVIPAFAIPGPTDTLATTAGWCWQDAYIFDPLTSIGALNLPITIQGTQPEGQLYIASPYKDEPEATNPKFVCRTTTGGCTAGQMVNYLDPLADNSQWTLLSQSYINNATNGEVWDALELAYPNPSLVLFLSNNEANKSLPSYPGGVYNAENSKRYTDIYGLGTPWYDKADVYRAAWNEKYGILIDGFRNSLPTGWQPATKFLAYQLHGNMTYFSRWGGWVEYSDSSLTGNILNTDTPWDGWEYQYYIDSGGIDRSVNSIQSEASNVVFFQENEIEVDAADKWQEMVTWGSDDNEAVLNALTPPQYHNKYRWSGVVQFGMWMTRPRSVREFFGSTTKRNTMVNSLAIKDIVQVGMEAVERVWDDPVLRRFWQYGDIVQNTAPTAPHPYNVDLATYAPQYENQERWYELTTDNEPTDWTLNNETPVRAMARVIGRSTTADDYQFLVYAHTPAGCTTLTTNECSAISEDNRLLDVTITIPGYDGTSITVDVDQEGSFYLVTDIGNTVEAVGLPFRSQKARVLLDNDGRTLNRERDFARYDTVTMNAATNQTFVLPSPSDTFPPEIGDRMRFCDTGGAGELVIDPDTAGSPTMSINGPSLAPAAGATITSPTGGGGCVTLELINATVWQMFDVAGTWTTP